MFDREALFIIWLFLILKVVQKILHDNVSIEASAFDPKRNMEFKNRNSRAIAEMSYLALLIKLHEEGMSSYVQHTDLTTRHLHGIRETTVDRALGSYW
ncbi:hypothetical protein WH96_10075 [Kiloniella spongiae]|uniref:Uncharacterized protein n=1 Tax=Kiloniella spongiae TaxID=1489064 RepID=A0A0H2MVR4_9PROT|nr:hypothetical protein WH96_10075 [Kiloniella spongiae]